MFDTLNDEEWARVDDAWELVESGEIEKARPAVDGLLRSRGRHPDIVLLDCALAIEEGRPDQAL